MLCYPFLVDLALSGRPDDLRATVRTFAAVGFMHIGFLWPVDYSDR